MIRFPTVCGISSILVLVACQVLLAVEEERDSVLKNALIRLEGLASYSYSISIKSDLYPGSSGMMTRVKLSDSGTVVLKRHGTVLKAREDRKTNEAIFALKILRKSQQDEKSTIWDGKWIYVYNKHGSPFKMVDCPENRGGNLPEDLYRSLLQDKSLAISGRQKVRGVECVVYESQADFLTQLLSIDSKAAVAINETNGFPVQIWTSKGKSKTVIQFDNVQVNPILNDALFVPSQSNKYDVLRGLEKDSEGDWAIGVSPKAPIKTGIE